MIPNRPTNGLRLLFLLFLTLLVLAASAQDALTPRWIRAGWPNLVETPQYSNAGDRLLLWNGTGTFNDRSQRFRVYRVADGAILAQVNFGQNSNATQGNLTGACLSADGTKVYYGTDHGLLYAFDIDSRNQSALSSHEKEGRPVYALTTSKDGKYLAYMAGDKSTPSFDVACVYNIATDKVETQFPLTKASGDRAKTSALAFVDGGTKLVASGPTVYSLTGTKRKQGTLDDSAPFVVSPDRTAIYVYNNSGFNPQVYAYNATNLSSGLTYDIRWQKPAPAGVRALGGVSSDGNAVVFSCVSNGVWSASGLNAANGSPIAAPFVTSTTLTASFVLPSPSSGVLLVTTGSLAELWNYNPLAGSGTFARTLFDGVGNGKPPTFVETRELGSPGKVAVVTDELHGTTVERVMRDAWTGDQLGPDLLAGAYPSPDGRFYVLLSGGGPFGGATGVNVYPTSGGPGVASISLTGSYSRVVWAGTGRFVVAGNAAGEALDFDGASLVEGSTFTFGGFFGGGGFSVSADGSKYAVWNGAFTSNTCKVYDASTGSLLRTIDSDPMTSGGIDAADFAGPDRIGVHELVKQDTGGFRNQIRIFDLTVSPAKVVRTVGYSITGDLDTSGAGAAGALSADGKTIVLGHRLKSLGDTDPRLHGSVQIYSAAGDRLNEWDDQLLPDMSGAAPFTFSLDGRTVRWTTDGAIVAVSTGSMLTVTLDPTSVPSESPSTGTVTVDEPVQGDTAFSLVSSSTAATVPSTVVILNGETSATFPITTKHVEANTGAKITASLGGQSSSATLQITVPSLDGLSLSTDKVAPGGSSTGTVILTAPAPPGGTKITLQASPASLVTLASPVTVPEGETSATFTVVVASTVAQGTVVTLTATHNTDTPRTANLTIVLPTVTSLTLVPTEVVGGTLSTGIVTISAAAPSGGTKVTLKSSLSAASVLGPVIVPQGETSTSFSIQTTSVTTSVTTGISAALGTQTPISRPLSVLAVGLRSFSFNPPSVVGGYGATTATVALKSPLPIDVTVNLSSANSSLVAVPATLTIPAGQTFGTFTITPGAVAAQTSVALKATLGNSSLPATLVVKPIELSKVEVAPTSVLGGSSVFVTGTVTLSGPAPATGAKVALGSSSTAAASVPATVTVPAGATTATFVVAHKGVAVTKTVTITATLGKTTPKSCPLEVRAPTLTSLSVSPSSVKGGSSTKMTGTVTISAPALSSGLKVTLKSSNTSALTVPSSVTLKNAVSATFAITHKKVKSTTNVTITATLSGQPPRTYQVTLTP